MCIRDRVIPVSPIVLIIRVVIVTVVITVVGVAVRTLVWPISPVIVVVGTVILIIPAIRLINLVVVQAITPVLVVIEGSVGLSSVGIAYHRQAQCIYEICVDS